MPQSAAQFLPKFGDTPMCPDTRKTAPARKESFAKTNPRGCRVPSTLSARGDGDESVPTTVTRPYAPRSRAVPGLRQQCPGLGHSIEAEGERCRTRLPHDGIALADARFNPRTCPGRKPQPKQQPPGAAQSRTPKARGRRSAPKRIRNRHHTTNRTAETRHAHVWRPRRAEQQHGAAPKPSNAPYQAKASP